ncbi:hemagglutinin repeat-containing protein [Endomicrobium proavitum]|uniref:Uncharacterized protein n=1 Tax=Endomicrobium proavitum TaxID=1408281 RepID=A0A0G3WHR5_9BACT|nr:hemagglutinin repeat-containing protein [Endomicrobium proavitum]AKL98196.1 exported protein of unknown function [Endomicrobium proavitum]
MKKLSIVLIILLAASIAGAASAASSSFGTGMYASAFANYDTMSQQSKSESILGVQGNIASNGNINFKSANDMIQEGTNAYATNGTLSYNVGNNLIIQASKDTYAQEDKSEHASAGVSVGNNSVQVSAGAGESSSKIKATTYNNSESVANNIEINVGNNATLSGANVTAKNNLDVTVGNNLTVESLQDTYYSKGNSWDANISVGIGTKSMGSLLGGEKSNAGNNSIGAGFNTGNDYTDSAWVTEQTSLTGGNNVNINVGNKTTVTGAVINSESNNLTLTTKELEHSDIEDRNITESKGFGLSTSIGTTQSDKGKTNVAPNGSTTLTLKNTGEEKEQKTKATIGNGTIIIGGVEQTENDLQGLNRNTETTQETTKDIITGALDASATIDNRALLGFIKTEVKDKDGKVIGYTTGYQSIANDFENLPGNAVKATAGALSTAASPLTAIYANITASKNNAENGENSAYDKTDIISVWKANQSANATGILRGSSEEAGTIVEKIKEGKASPEEIQALAKMTADGKSNLMYSEKGELIDSAGKVVLGFNDIKEHQGYVNLGNGAATNALTFALTDAEERAHNYTGNENIAKGAAKSELTYYNAVSWLTGGKTITENNSNTGGYGTLTQLSWNNTYNTSNNTLLKENTIAANAVADENKAYQYQPMLYSLANTPTVSTVIKAIGATGVAVAIVALLDNIENSKVSVYINSAEDHVLDLIEKALDISTPADPNQFNQSNKQDNGDKDPKGVTNPPLVPGVKTSDEETRMGQIVEDGLAAFAIVSILRGSSSGLMLENGVLNKILSSEGNSIGSIAMDMPTLGGIAGQTSKQIAKGAVKEGVGVIGKSVVKDGLGELIPVVSKTTGKEVMVNKAAYNAGIEALSLGKEVRIIGPDPAYKALSEVLGTHAYSVKPEIWQTWSVTQKSGANETFLLRGANKNAVFIYATPETGIRTGSWTEWEVNKLVNELLYKTSDGMIFTK